MSVQSVLLRIKNRETGSFLIFPLLCLVIGSAVYGITQIVRDLKFDSYLIIALGALTLTWVFARIKISGWIAGCLIISIGTVLIFIWVGHFWSSFRSSIYVLDDLLGQIYRYVVGLSDTPELDWSRLSVLQVRVESIFLELSLWFRPLIAGQPIYNLTANTLLWGVTIYSVSAWAGWFQSRYKQTLIAVFPAGLLLMITMGYTYGSTTALYPFSFAVLLLIALSFYFQRETSWKSRNMDCADVERLGNLSITLSITIALLVASAIVSQISINGIMDAIREFVEPQGTKIDTILGSFGLEGDSTSLGKMGSVVIGGLPRKHLIGSGPELSDQIVMSVKLEADFSGEILPVQALQDLSFPLYWRGITYDRYTGYGWESSEVVLQNYAAGEPTYQQLGKLHQILHQTIHYEGPNDLIYAAGEPYTLNTDYSIAWRKREETTENLGIGGDVFAGSQGKLDYRIDSLVPVVSDADLHAVENIYPTWVVERYLPLPQNVSRRVFDLALEVTQNSPTVYSKASALEAYLRTIKYELNLPAPPENRELSDYFLFELQKGYCDYFATAMVVMARSIGIPARIAVGYAQGDYDPNQQHYVVSEKNAHSWVEIYFAEIGWIPFEPTPAQPVINRVSRSSDLRLGEEPSKDVTVQDTSLKQVPDRSRLWLGLVFACLTLAVIFWPLLDNLYLSLLSPAKMTTNLFKRLFRFGRLIGTPAKMGDTPYEFTVMLSAQIRVVSQHSRWDSYIRKAIDDLKILSHFYVFSMFSPHKISKAESRRILLLWKRLNGRLLLIAVVKIWHRITRSLIKDSPR